MNKFGKINISKAMAVLFTLKLLFILVIILLPLSCKKEIRSDNKNPKNFFWAGSPASLQKEPFEYFYLHRTEYVKENILDQRDGKLIKETCMKQSRENAKQILLESMISNSIRESEDTPFRFVQEKNLYRELDFEYKEKTPELMKCEPSTYSQDKIPDGEYEICECTVYFHHKGGRKDIQKKFENHWRLMDENRWAE